MINPAALMKVMNLKNNFVADHPKFASFIGTIGSQGISEGDIIEVTITRSGVPITANMRVTQSDLEAIETLKSLNA